MPRADSWERFSWAGQGLAIDLADTIVVVRENRVIDHLSTARQLADWLELEREWLGEPPADALDHLEQFRELRGAIRSLFFAVTEGGPILDRAVELLNDSTASAPWFRELEVVSSPASRLRSVAAGTTKAVFAAIADNAIQLLGGSDADRLRVCPAPSCGMFFLAESPRQRWCRDACGNRARVARYHARSARRRS